MNSVLVTVEDRRAARKASAPGVLAQFNSTLKSKSIELAREVLKNYPEYSSESIRCSVYYYDKEEYTFLVEDPDNEGSFKKATVTAEEVAQSIPQFYMLTMIGETQLEHDSFWDPGCWDADILDHFMQLFFYGELVFC